MMMGDPVILGWHMEHEMKTNEEMMEALEKALRRCLMYSGSWTANGEEMGFKIPKSRIDKWAKSP